MIFRTMIRLFLYIMFLIPLYGCSNVDSDLLESIHIYYRHEQEKSWDKTYEMRTEAFRSSTEFEYYQKTMAEDYSGWELLGYEIKSIDSNVNEYILSIVFDEKPSESYKKSHFVPDDINRLRIIDESIWKKEYGEWKCVSAGHRYVLSLNSRIE